MFAFSYFNDCRPVLPRLFASNHQLSFQSNSTPHSFAMSTSKDGSTLCFFYCTSSSFCKALLASFYGTLSRDTATLHLQYTTKFNRKLRRLVQCNYIAAIIHLYNSTFLCGKGYHIKGIASSCFLTVIYHSSLGIAIRKWQSKRLSLSTSMWIESQTYSIRQPEMMGNTRETPLKNKNQINLANSHRLIASRRLAIFHSEIFFLHRY